MYRLPLSEWQGKSCTDQFSLCDIVVESQTICWKGPKFLHHFICICLFLFDPAYSSFLLFIPVSWMSIKYWYSHTRLHFMWSLHFVHWFVNFRTIYVPFRGGFALKFVPSLWHIRWWWCFTLSHQVYHFVLCHIFQCFVLTKKNEIIILEERV